LRPLQKQQADTTIHHYGVYIRVCGNDNRDARASDQDAKSYDAYIVPV
jgi:hypothetical protein